MPRSLLAITIDAQAMFNSYKIMDEQAVIEEALRLIEPDFHDSFRSLIENFEPDVRFLAYWERDANCQKAITMVFQFRLALLEKMASLFREISDRNATSST